MASMAKNPKRPRDPNQLAKLIADIATGNEINVVPAPNGQADIIRQGAIAGGRARAESLSPERRSEISRSAAQERWRKN